MTDKIDISADIKSSSSFSSSDWNQQDLTSKFKEFLLTDIDDSIRGDLDTDNTDKENADNYNIGSAYIQTLCFIIEHSTQTTFQGLNVAIKRANDQIFKKVFEDKILTNSRSLLTLRAVSEISMNFIEKHISKKLSDEFIVLKTNIVSLLKDLHIMNDYAKQKISNFFKWYIKSNLTLLIHGYNTTLINALVNSKKNGVNFKVLITEARPENSGAKILKILKSYGIEAEIILDISVGYYMKDVDCVLVGADAVCENGGIINRIGTFTCALCCKNFKKPFYVMVESLKFLKMYPLDQYDIPQFIDYSASASNGLNGVEEKREQLSSDYTPPEFITLLFTDIGIFTPSAVSDELIQMYYN